MFSERLQAVLAVYGQEATYASVNMRVNQTGEYLLQHMQDAAGEMLKSGMHEDQVVLYVLDATVTGVRYGNW